MSMLFFGGGVPIRTMECGDLDMKNICVGALLVDVNMLLKDFIDDLSVY